MTKPFSLLAVLVGVLLLSAGACVALCLWYVRILGAGEAIQARIRQFEGPMVTLNRNRSLFQAIGADAIEFGKKSPQMNNLLAQHGPLLENLGLKPKAAPTRPEVSAPARPATNPPANPPVRR